MKHYLPILLAVALAACASSKEDSRPIAKLPSQIPPNHCRILGVVSAINNARSTDAQSPCAKAPCKAKVKITKILGYGSGFAKPLAEGSEVEMTFAFTLAPTTKELFPNLAARYKGLKLGDAFQADVESVVKLGEEKPSLTVISYEVK